MSLRDVIKPQHDSAEKHPLTVAMLSGRLTPSAYADLLYNQLRIYTEIEKAASSAGLLTDLPGLCRADSMQEDLDRLLVEYKLDQPCIFESTVECVEYLKQVDNSFLMAHVYVNHMADMYGGQIIKKHLYGECKRYDFPNRTDLINAVRSKLSDNLAEEAKVAFDFTLRLFNDVAKKHDL
jgi:heme oxygenase